MLLLPKGQTAHSPHVKRSDTQTKTNKGFRPAVVKAKAVYCFAKKWFSRKLVKIYT